MTTYRKIRFLTAQIKKNSTLLLETLEQTLMVVEIVSHRSKSQIIMNSPSRIRSVITLMKKQSLHNLISSMVHQQLTSASRCNNNPKLSPLLKYSLRHCTHELALKM